MYRGAVGRGAVSRARPTVFGDKGVSPDLYDTIWAAELPPIMDGRDTRAPAVAPAIARMVLMAMASFTNPTGDQEQGPTRRWQCRAAVATIAEKADVSSRQVQRVLRALEHEGYIERVYQARRPGRPRKNQNADQGRPNMWRLRPDLWRRRDYPQRGPGQIVPTGAQAETGGRREQRVLIWLPAATAFA